ncbi:hypothetical protein PWT90_11185 [Aphanocladium album]|nr:hypothetical protein PWT90_11185 [Aphanocladium album]
MQQTHNPGAENMRHDGPAAATGGRHAWLDKPTPFSTSDAVAALFLEPFRTKAPQHTPGFSDQEALGESTATFIEAQADVIHNCYGSVEQFLAQTTCVGKEASPSERRNRRFPAQVTRTPAPPSRTGAPDSGLRDEATLPSIAQILEPAGASNPCAVNGPPPPPPPPLPSPPYKYSLPSDLTDGYSSTSTSTSSHDNCFETARHVLSAGADELFLYDADAEMIHCGDADELFLPDADAEMIHCGDADELFLPDADAEMMYCGGDDSPKPDTVGADGWAGDKYMTSLSDDGHVERCEFAYMH